MLLLPEPYEDVLLQDEQLLEPLFLQQTFQAHLSYVLQPLSSLVQHDEHVLLQQPFLTLPLYVLFLQQLVLLQQQLFLLLHVSNVLLRLTSLLLQLCVVALQHQYA